MNVLFFGSAGPLSIIPLRFLLQSSYKPVAIGYESATEISFKDFKYPVFASQNDSVEMLAHRADVPTIKLFDDEDKYVDEVKACEPDIIIVSCLAGKLPENILNIPELGCFNLHPSLLPAFRGPVPLFWQFRQGIEQFGMTLHRMNSDYDKGPIIAQSKLTMSDGITNQQASERLAETGSGLLEQFLDKIEKGEVVEQIQNESRASYMSYPVDSDFTVSTSWVAKRMYNFICATTHWDMTYTCEVAGRNYQIIEAIAYRTGTDFDEVFDISENIITIPCVDGTVKVKVVPEQSI